MNPPEHLQAPADHFAEPGITPDLAALRKRHPLSEAFGDLDQDEFDGLVDSIKRNGLLTAITTAEDKSILDGWHRYKACLQAGVEPRFEPFDYVVEPAAEMAGRKMTEADFVLAQNAHRRHLTAGQKRNIIAALLKADPNQSNRLVAAALNVDDKTVAAVRTELVSVAEIPHVTKRTGRDGKVYTAPVLEPKPLGSGAPDVVAPNAGQDPARAEEVHLALVDGLTPDSSVRAEAAKPVRRCSNRLVNSQDLDRARKQLSDAMRRMATFRKSLPAVSRDKVETLRKRLLALVSTLDNILGDAERSASLPTPQEGSNE